MAERSIRRGAQGRRIPHLQRGIDKTLGEREFDWRKVPIDGVAGEATFGAARMALWLMGGSEEQLRKIRRGVITDHAYRLLTHRVERSAAMKKRDRQRRDDAKKLRQLHRESQREDQDGLSLWRGFTVAAWMVGDATGPDGKRVNWLQRSVDEGWSGGLYSGFRDPAYSEQLCFNICNQPSCPGLCAGRSSNHSGKDGSPPGWGAIDAQDYINFGRIQARIGSPLKNALPNDRPHFSATGN